MVGFYLKATFSSVGLVLIVAVFLPAEKVDSGSVCTKCTPFPTITGLPDYRTAFHGLPAFFLIFRCSTVYVLVLAFVLFVFLVMLATHQFLSAQ